METGAPKRNEVIIMTVPCNANEESTENYILRPSIDEVELAHHMLYND
ncbi:hypothetical protein [Paenibacillus sp.]